MVKKFVRPPQKNALPQFPPLPVRDSGRGRPSFAAVVASARQAGVSPETVSALERENEAVRSAQQKPGTKLNVLEQKVDVARSTVGRLNKRLDRLKQELQQTSQELATAQSAQEQAEREVQQLRLSLANETTPAPAPSDFSEVLRQLTTLLGTLDQHRQALPEAVGSSAAALRTSLALTQPLDERADAVLGPEEVEDHDSNPSDGGSELEEARDGADAVMKEIVLGSDDASTEELASLAKRLKAAHRSTGRWAH